MKRLRIIVAGVLAALCVAGCSTEPLKVVSFNVRLSADDDGPDGWQFRRDAAVRMIDSLKPDLLGLQEVLPDQKAFLDSALCRYAHVGVGRDDGAAEGETMEIFFNSERFELSDSGTFWLSQTPDSCSFGWDAACRRTATWVELKDHSSGRRLLYVNTHLDHEGVEARRRSARMIAEFIENRKCRHAILTGDMNVVPDDEALSPFRAVLSDARREAPVSDSRITYNAFGNKADQVVIDYVFYKGLQPVSFRTVDCSWGVPYVSDHYPVEAVFE